MARRDALLRLHRSLMGRRDELRKRLGGELQDLRGFQGDASTGDSADLAFDSGSEEVSSQLAELIEYLPVEGLTSSVAQAYGEIRAALETQGRVIGNNDIWIAAHAMALDVTLATNNEREFLRVTGLSVENWTK